MGAIKLVDTKLPNHTMYVQTKVNHYYIKCKVVSTSLTHKVAFVKDKCCMQKNTIVNRISLENLKDIRIILMGEILLA